MIGSSPGAGYPIPHPSSQISDPARSPNLKSAIRNHFTAPKSQYNAFADFLAASTVLRSPDGCRAAALVVGLTFADFAGLAPGVEPARVAGVVDPAALAAFGGAMRLGRTSMLTPPQLTCQRW